MENATDALKMAASVLIFVGALSLAMFSLTYAKKASATVMSAESEESYYDIELDNVSSVREVGIETIIPNLYSYYKNYNTILFYTGKWNDKTKSLEGGLTKVPLYYTEALETSRSGKKSALDKSILRIDQTRAIFGLDINDERTRQEPWVYGDGPKNFIDSLINGVASPEYTWSRAGLNDSNTIIKKKNFFGDSNSSIEGIKINFTYKNSMGEKTLMNNASAKFIERIGKYNYKTLKSTVVKNGQVKSGETVTEDSQIIFSNGESIDNENETEKTVIQYIYVGNK